MRGGVEGRRGEEGKMEKEKRRRGGLYSSDCDVLKERWIQTPHTTRPL